MPHIFLEIQSIPWPGPEPVPNLGWELANSGLGIGYLAQQSLLYDPMEFFEVIKQALSSKNREPQELVTFVAEKANPNSEVNFHVKTARRLPTSILTASEEAIFGLGRLQVLHPRHPGQSGVAWLLERLSRRQQMLDLLVVILLRVGSRKRNYF